MSEAGNIAMNTSKRVKREKEHYNSGTVMENNLKLQNRFHHVFSCPNTQKGEDYFRQNLNNLAKNAVVLDYGCFEGRLCPKLIENGARKIIGIDISDLGVSLARKNYGHLAEFHCMDAHKTTFEDKSFDLIVGRAILHHLDYKVAVKEIHRILKVGGHALFFEPLMDNPAAKFIRYITPHARTPDESPLSRKQIEWADNFFGMHEHDFINLFSVPAGMISSFIFKTPDNPLTRTADLTDSIIEKTCMRYWMRQAILLWRKT